MVVELWVLVAGGLCFSLLLFLLIQSSKKLKRIKSDLQEQVSQTNQLIREAERANEMAEKYNKEKSAFLANIGHEIRTPMSGILGFAELAADDENISEETKDYLDKMKESVEGLLAVINDITDISEIEAGSIVLKTATFSMEDVLHSCIATGHANATEKGLAFKTQIDPRVNMRVAGDEEKLKQVLVCLLSNAVKFTDSGFVQLTAMAAFLDANSITVTFEVKDTGIGILPEQMSFIFDSFTQADSATTRRYGGTGVGLSIASKLLKRMGSELVAESTLGVGSVFRFQLVFHIQQEAVAVPPVLMGHILVCEDDETNRLVIQGNLLKMGFHVDIAENGRLGVALAKEQMQKNAPYDLILMDIYMPVMDGAAAAQKLVECGNQTPVIALTANASAGDVKRFQEIGISGYLAKPFNAKGLKECLVRHLPPGLLQEWDKNNGGIDTQTAMEQYEGDEETYSQIVESFAKNHKDSWDKIYAALRCNDFYTAHRAVHSLSGAAGMIGATKLAKAADVLEQLLLPLAQNGAGNTDTGAPDFTSPLAHLKSEFNAVFGKLRKIVKQRKEDNLQERTLNKEKTLELLHTIAPLLKTGDAKSLEYLEEVEETFQGIIKNCQNVIRQIEQCDFDLAYETVQKMQSFIKN